MSIGKPVTRKVEAIKSDELIDEILDRMIAGGSLRSICMSDEENMPRIVTFLKWVAQDPELEIRYQEAMRHRADVKFEEMMDIANTPVEAEIVKTGPKGVEVTVKDAIEHRTLQVRTMMWCIARMNPKKYADLSMKQISGPDGGPVKTESTVVNKELSDDELKAELENRGIPTM